MNSDWLFILNIDVSEPAVCTSSQNVIKISIMIDEKNHNDLKPNAKMSDVNETLLPNSSTMKENLLPPQKNIRLRNNESKGLCNIRAFLFLVLWYIFSGCTLFLNKYILSYMHGDPTILGELELHFIFGNVWSWLERIFSFNFRIRFVWFICMAVVIFERLEFWLQVRSKWWWRRYVA